MPRGVFHVVGVDGAVRFELRAAVLIAAGVIERDAALPELGSLVGDELGQSVESNDRFGDVAASEIGHGAVENRLRTFWRRLRIAGAGDRRVCGRADSIKVRAGANENRR